MCDHLSVCENKHQFAFASYLSVQKDTTGSFASSCTDVTERGLNLHFVARSYLASESSRINSAKKGQLRTMNRVCQQCVGTHLRNRLTHQHTGQGRTTREVSRKKPFISCQFPQTRSTDTHFKCNDSVDEQERRLVRQHVDGRREIAHFFNAFSRLVGVSAGEILYHAFRTTPS